MSQVWTMELTEETNIFHFSDRFATRIKVNIKEIFMETMFSRKFLFGEWTAFRE